MFVKGFVIPPWQRAERDGSCTDQMMSFAWAVMNRPGATGINTNRKREQRRISKIRRTQWLKGLANKSKVNLRYTQPKKRGKK